MSTSPVIEMPQATAGFPVRLPWWQIGWFTALVIVCYAPILRQLVRVWATDGDMGHGFFVVPVAAFLAWQRRRLLTAEPAQSNPWGLAILAWGCSQAIAATLAAELYTQRLAVVITITGIVFYLGGRSWLRILRFPLFLLLFMIPIPQIIYSQLTMRLQTTATILAEMILTVIGIPVLRSGNVLELPSQSLNVAEACSGIRSMLSLAFLALVYAYFRENRRWVRAFLFLCSVPIAIGANAIRVAVAGVLSEMNNEWARGAYHEAEGYIVFAIALGALIGVHVFVNLVSKSVASTEPRAPASEKETDAEEEE
jgi:exosortase